MTLIDNIAEMLRFESAHRPLPPARKWQMNLDVMFCSLLTLAMTWWFGAFNMNVARDGAALSPPAWFGVNLVMYGLSLLPLLLAVSVDKAAFKIQAKDALGLQYRPGVLKSKLKWIGMLLVLSLLILLFRRLLRVGGQITPLRFLFEIPTNAVIAFCEEMMFRGYVQGKMARRFGDLPGVVIAAALFTTVHLPVRILLASGNPAQLAFQTATTFAGGVVFGIIARKDRCMHGSAAVHYAFNMCHYVGML